MFNHSSKNDKLIDSLRAVIFSYCCMSMTFGSLTVRKEYEGDKYPVVLPDPQDLWAAFAQENRNIHEIFVHVLDLNYFYGSRLSLYIPLIWGSWIGVPHINGDVRQYILRSLLTIASKSKAKSMDRFKWSVDLLDELLSKYAEGKLNFPIIHEVLKILKDFGELKKYYWPAFKASLILVDMVNQIFISANVRAQLFDDEYVKWDDADEEEDSFELKFEYQLPNSFHDENITAPLAFLLDRMAKVLEDKNEINDIERETTFLFLALNSN